MALLDEIKSINCGILQLSEFFVIKIIFGDNSQNTSAYTLTLDSSIDYVIYNKKI